VYNGFAAKNGQNGFRDVPPTRDLLCRLTSREQEVVNLVVEGLSSKAAAARLGISVKTVEAHRANIMRKLSINNVAQLVRYVYRGELPSG
jgi:DNA-binding NarL/FixJ family response regulator